MKKIFFVLIFAVFSICTDAQLQIRPLPSKDYERRISEYVNNIRVIDTHEHLFDPKKLTQWTSLDFILLLSHYACDDIRSAGMSNQDFNVLMKDSLSVAEKWKMLEPYWEGTKNTAYNRVALLAASSLFGIDDINGKTVVPLSEKIRKAYQTDWFYQVIEKANIEYLIQDGTDRSFGNEKFRYVERFDNFINIRSGNNIRSIGKQFGISIETLDDLVAALDKAFNAAKERGFVGVKSGLAYSRILLYENVDKQKAGEVFQTVMNPYNKRALAFTDVKPLQDYMMHRVIEKAKENDIPMVIHTGLHAGNGNIIENSKPTHLVNLFREYPDVKFVIYHGSFPYGGELTSIAKNFRNVYIDMCWLYIISPSYSERFLHEWLETVPANKIMAFGGDYRNVENLYGHLLFGRQIVSKVLVSKVKDSYFTEAEAKSIAKMILHDNAEKLYKLKSD